MFQFAKLFEKIYELCKTNCRLTALVSKTVYVPNGQLPHWVLSLDGMVQAIKECDKNSNYL